MLPEEYNVYWKSALVPRGVGVPCENYGALSTLGLCLFPSLIHSSALAYREDFTPELQNPKADWAVLTEVTWALGKMPDKRSIQPLYDLDKKLQTIRDPDNVKLEEAVFCAIKQCNTRDQYS